MRPTPKARIQAGVVALMVLVGATVVVGSNYQVGQGAVSSEQV